MDDRLVMTTLGGILGGGGLTALLSAYFAKRKTDAEASSVKIEGELKVVAAANNLVDKLSEEIDRLSAKVRHLEESLIQQRADFDEQLKELRVENRKLRAENKDLRKRCEELEKKAKR